MEIWHSLLQNYILSLSPHYSGDELHNTAISLAALDTARKFHSPFVRPYTRGQSEKKKKKHMRLVAGNVLFLQLQGTTISSFIINILTQTVKIVSYCFYHNII